MNDKIIPLFVMIERFYKRGINLLIVGDRSETILHRVNTEKDLEVSSHNQLHPRVTDFIGVENIEDK